MTLEYRGTMPACGASVAVCFDSCTVKGKPTGIDAAVSSNVLHFCSQVSFTG